MRIRVFSAVCAGLMAVGPAAAALPSATAASRPGRPDDFNGDGHTDLAFGEPLASVGATLYAGRVRVVYGAKNGPTAKPSQNITQNSAGVPGSAEYDDGFGDDVVSADFNADGYADLAVAAGNEFVGDTGHGTITILFGGKKGLSGSRSFAVTFPRDDYLDGRMQAADLNRDGIPDLVVNGVHAPYVLVGDRSLTTRHTLRRLAPPDGDADVQAALVGDVNGDGRPDLTTPYISALTGWKTAFAVYFGGSGSLPQPPQRGFGGDDRQNSGGTFGMGDVNGDGAADLVIGNDGSAESTRPGGQVTVWLGGTTPFAVRDTISQDSGTIPGAGAAGDRFGASLAVGDVNGDHRADVVVGGPGQPSGSARQAGAIWIVYGGSRSLGSNHDQMFTQTSAGVPGAAHTNAGFGRSVGLLDVNRDGRLDPIATSAHDQAIIVLHGGAKGVTTSGAWQVKPVGDTGEYALPR